MTGLDLLQDLSWAIYVVIFLLVLVRALRRPTPAHTHMALFFGVTTMVIVTSTVTSLLDLPTKAWIVDATSVLLMSMPYVLLRLVADFSDVPTVLMRACGIGLLISVVLIVAVPAPLPPLVVLLLVGYFVVVISYDTWAFAREARHTTGVTRRRMQAVAAGSAAIGLILLLAGIGVVLPDWAVRVSEASIIAGLASGIFYFIGFAPPTWLRRAWQEPELRLFLSRAASLPRLPDTLSIVRELEQGAASSVGAPSASIGLWDANDARLHFFYSPPVRPLPEPATAADDERPPVVLDDQSWAVDPTRHAGVGQAFIEQRPILIADTLRADPANAPLYEAYNSRSSLVAPISAGEKRIGVLAVNAPRAPVFANSDLELVQLLADQAAVVLEARGLLEEAARVHAREEAARLKDDFLSSAAHDLKTPLTGLVTQAQLLQRRAERNPGAPVDRVGLDRLVEQVMRLRDLVLELLDVSRLEQGGLIGEREVADLGELVRTTVKREGARWKRVEVETERSVYANVDVFRVEQVLTNLVENGLKYSSPSGRIWVRVWHEANEARLSVRDEGIGIPIEDQPLVFERFHRARNVDDRRFAGMGLGLYIARGIVEEHGGRIRVISALGEGSTFEVALPAAPAPGQHQIR